MESMKRKVIQLAGKTLVVSLPAKWARKFNIIKGDEIELSESKDSIILKKSGSIEYPTQTADIDITGMPTSMVWRTIFSAFRTGAEELEVTHNDLTITDMKTNKKIDSRKLIQIICNKLIGMEVLKQSKTRSVIRELSAIKKDELDNVIRKLLSSIQSMSEEVSIIVTEQNEEYFDSVMLMESNINKLSNYALRIINKHKHELENAQILYSVIIMIEEIGDKYTAIAKRAMERKQNTKYKDLLEKTHRTIDKFNKCFFNIKKEDLIIIHKMRSDVKKDISNIKKKPQTRIDGELLYSLELILDNIAELQSSMLTTTQIKNK